MLTRREFGKLALAGLPAATVLGRASRSSAPFAQAKPNSLIERRSDRHDHLQLSQHAGSERRSDAQIHRRIRHQCDRADGRAGRELCRRARMPAAAAAVAAVGGPGGRWAGSGLALQRRPACEAPQAPGSWNGQPCWRRGPVGRARRGCAVRARPEVAAAAASMTPEQQAAQQEQADKLKAWRTSVSMEPFKKLRKMYNDAGVTIYAWKQLSTNMSDEEFEYIFNVAEALGCTHTTLELPTDAAQLKRIGEFAMKKKIYAGVPHARAGQHDCVRSGVRDVEGQHGERRLRPLGGGRQCRRHARCSSCEKHHDRIVELSPEGSDDAREHCSLNLPWGTGETPIKEILQMVKKNKWTMPGSIELEYDIPEGSDAVKEVRKCVEYCRNALLAT